MSGMLRPPPTRHQASAAFSGAGDRKAECGPIPAFRSPIPSPRQLRPVTARFLGALRSGEHAARGSRSGNGRQADGEPDGDRRLVIAGGWLEVAVEMASVIDVGTVHATTAAGRDRCGGSAEPAPVPAGADATRARQPRVQVARSAFLRVPRGAILWPVMAGGAWRGIATVYVGAFCGSDEESGLAPFQGCAEAGNRAKQDVHKTALCIDRARSIHKLIPVPRPCRKFPSGILRRRARRAWRGN